MSMPMYVGRLGPNLGRFSFIRSRRATSRRLRLPNLLHAAGFASRLRLPEETGKLREVGKSPAGERAAMDASWGA